MAVPGPDAAAPALAAPPKFVPSKSGKDKLLHEGFMYVERYVDKKGVTSWICDTPGCKAMCKTKKENDNITMVEVPEHGHLPAPERATVAIVKGRIREGVQHAPRDTVQQVVSDSLANVHRADMIALPSTRSLKRSAWAAKATDTKKKRGDADPDEPDIDYSSKHTFTIPPSLANVGDERFLLHDDGVAHGDSRIVMFATQTGLDMLAACDLWLADGTFRKAPDIYEQSYTVHGFHRGFTLPCVFSGLPNKTQPMYTRFYNILFSKVPRGVAQDDPTVLLDFEKAVFQVVALKVGWHNVGGCYFHFSQAVMKHVQTLGLRIKYGSDLAFRLRVGMLRALSFLPEEAVESTFQQLEAKFEVDEKPLLTYFEKTWIGEPKARGGRKAPLFPLSMWSVHKRAKEGNLLTTNNAELYHRHFRNLSREHFSTSHM